MKTLVEKYTKFSVDDIFTGKNEKETVEMDVDNAIMTNWKLPSPYGEMVLFELYPARFFVYVPCWVDDEELNDIGDYFGGHILLADNWKYDFVEFRPKIFIQGRYARGNEKIMRTMKSKNPKCWFEINKIPFVHPITNEVRVERFQKRPATQYERLEIDRLGFVDFYIGQKLAKECKGKPYVYVWENGWIEKPRQKVVNRAWNEKRLS